MLGEPNFQNRTLFHGDNLKFLRGLNSESIDLIATDPPFKKGRDFHATPNSLAAGARFQDRWSWADDVEQAWIDQIEDDWPAVHAVIEATKTTYGEDMAAFLCFMGVRLLEMHRILRSDGSIYLHIDPTAHAYVKMLLDAVFGKRNFRNEVVWKRTGSHNSTDGYGPVHDVIMYYTKGDNYCWNQIRIAQDEYIAQRYTYIDERGRRFYPVSLLAAGTRRGSSGMPWRGIDVTAKGNHWRYTIDRLEELAY